MARLLAGYDRSHTPEQRLGGDRALLGLVVALFHDAGYIRQTDDTVHRNGAEFTRTHVGRSAHFLARYLPTIGMADWVPVATQIVHFTGYEVRVRPDPPRRPARPQGRPPARHGGHDGADVRSLLPREVPRPPLSRVRARRRRGVALRRRPQGHLRLGPRRAAPDAGVRRRDDAHAARRRVRRRLPLRRSAVRRPQPVHGSDRAQPRLPRQVLETRRWSMLRRVPPCFTWEKNPLQNMRALVIGHLRAAVRTWARTVVAASLRGRPASNALEASTVRRRPRKPRARRDAAAS